MRFFNQSTPTSFGEGSETPTRAPMRSLPRELLETLFRNLREEDQLHCALVCRGGPGMNSAPRFTSDVCFDPPSDNANRATQILNPSDHQYVKLRLSDGKRLQAFRVDSWTKIANNLQALDLEFCEASNVAIFAIIQECRKLRSLTMTDDLNMSLFSPPRLPQGASFAQIQLSLRNIRHLSILCYSTTLTNAAIHKTFIMMPNLSSFCLVGRRSLEYCSDIFHDEGSGFDLLTFDNLLTRMKRSRHKFKSLDFSFTNISSEALVQIVDCWSESLLKLRLDMCNRLGPAGFEAISRCTKLQLLSLHDVDQIKDDHFESILPNCSNLKSLDIGQCSKIENSSFLEVLEAKKLRHLDVENCRLFLNYSLCRLHKLTQLQHLNLSDTECDVKVLQRVAYLKNLRVLELRHCKRLDTVCLTVICNHLGKLEHLDLRWSPIPAVKASEVKFHQLKKLRTLKIGNEVEITDDFFASGIGSLQMKVLELGNPVTDFILCSIATFHDCLEQLRLLNCSQITDVGLEHLVKHLPRLRSLWLTGGDFKDRSFSAILHNCGHLDNIIFDRCKLSKHALDLLIRYRPDIDIEQLD